MTDWNQPPCPATLRQALLVGVQRPCYRVTAFRVGASHRKWLLMGDFRLPTFSIWIGFRKPLILVRTFRMIGIALYMLFSIGGASTSAAPSPRECKFDKSYKIASTIDQLPRDIAEDFRHRYPYVSESGSIFQRDDVSDATRKAAIERFAGAIHIGSKWFLWFEHGGQYHVHVVAYISASSVPRADGDYMIQPYGTLVGPPCDATKALLTGVRAPSPEDR